MPLRLGDIVKSVRDADLIITPSLNQWLVTHGDDPVPEDIAKFVFDQMVTAGRDRTKSFSASSRGQCLRRQELQFLGIPTVGVIDPRLQMIFLDGTWRHLRWQVVLLMAGLLDRAEMPLWWRKLRTRGTIDGIGTVSMDHPRALIRGKEFGFELKGTNSHVYRRAVKQEEGTKHEHKLQVATYFLMLGVDLWVTIYENKDTQEWFEWVEFPDQKYLDLAQKELSDLNRAITKERLTPMLAQCKIQTGEFHECPFGGRMGPCARAGSWPNLKKYQRMKGNNS